jgi:hypothetical protein
LLYSFAQWLESTRVSVAIQSHEWIIPTIQSIHIVTIGIVFVSLLVVASRVMGWVRTDQPFGMVVRRFSPWIAKGLVVLAATGLTLVLGEPIRELMSLSFWLKMGLLAIAVTSAAAFQYSLGPAVLAGVRDPQFSAAAKIAAMATVLLWLAIIFLGRAIAYDIEVWGSLSWSPRLSR